MNTCKSLLLIATALYAVTAQAQSDTPMALPGSTNSVTTRTSAEATSNTGSIIRKELRWRSKIPLNKTYGELSPEQKAELHSMYESIPEGDEPPFPLEGIKPIFNAVKKAQAKREARGQLDLAVTVGADGTPTKVEDYSAVTDPEIVKFAASVLMSTKFKPAVCKGSPCAMPFPFKIKLSGG